MQIDLFIGRFLLGRILNNQRFWQQIRIGDFVCERGGNYEENHKNPHRRITGNRIDQTPNQKNKKFRFSENSNWIIWDFNEIEKPESN